MKKLKIAVISDIHVGLGARAKDLCPEPPKSDRKGSIKYNAKTDNAFREGFVQFVNKQEPPLTADYLILPGDLTCYAKPQEVEIASHFVLQAADALSVPHESILFVPGNHDVDWSTFDPADTHGVRWGQRYVAIGYEKFQFSQIIKRGSGNILTSPHFTIWDLPDLFAVGYNSASHDKPLPEDNAHHGLADPEDLSALRAQLEKLVPSDDRLRLFLVHHHAFDFSNPIPKIPDFSLMTNAEHLLGVLHEYSFDILVHGHKHHPRFETHSTLTYPHLPVLCSGSFSVELDTEWAGTVENQFHLITVDGRAGPDKRISGVLTSWSKNHAKGWIPSEESTSGIHHIIPFGSYLMPAELDARLEPFISQWLTKHDHILWRDVVQQFPDLEHLPLNSAIAAFKRMERPLGRQSMYQTLKDLILY
jgi:UDP-2,3-diacylglucosamine pyrophosphatase LpxH